MAVNQTLLLNRTDISSLMGMKDYIRVVEEAFRLFSSGEVLTPGLLHIDSDDGEFHIKAGGLRMQRIYFGLKSNGGFFSNMQKYGLPNIQGLILLHDGEKGSPISILDSGYITIFRTGASTAVAAKYLSRTESRVVTICGCGTQGRIQLQALAEVRPIEKAYAIDQDKSKVLQFCADMSEKLNIEVIPGMLEEAVPKSDICVTCTPSKQYFLKNEILPPGIFVAAVGADSPEKQELQPEVISKNKVVADILEQCISVGEIHHALSEDLMSVEDIYGDIGSIINGKLQGRTEDSEIFIFDSTGTALQDVAAAATIYEKAIEQGLGTMFPFPS